MREVQTMRKHSARKWLHFVLDLLPILVLPIFAIYEINHDNNEPITVSDGAWEHRAKYETNEVNSVNDLQGNNVYHFNSLFLEINYASLDYLTFNILKCESTQPLLNGYGLDNSYITINNYDSNVDNTLRIYYGDDEGIFLLITNNNAYAEITFDDTELTLLNLDFYIGVDDIDNFKSFCTNRDILPTSSSFQVFEYVYNENHVYDNTDIGSQMLYAIYKPVKDYFNFNNVFNFGDIYHWFELNMFGGNAPMPIFIIWNIIVYQFLMDLMFLVYSIFMFIIDFTSECLERCFSFSRHGGSR